ncbi:alpha/beta-hydrolase [Cylindrobasidium torrendii FP15055 ss-10]|uniref:Alpha/beta-hydrolase n=1 Tax=Cylindrobasidium torrendii FP15055 ss-10 TaxID=1314674 RepID=A0A0D7BJW0_9AGAR|nr:alpha/beta-hydrolase [Cylindrobasidium torrendii FP15055 ss-10]
MQSIDNGPTDISDVDSRQTQDSFIIEARGLKNVARRYLPEGSSGILSASRPGYILVFAHGTGFHKEQWSVTIERLMQHGANPSVLEAWAMDSPTHGQSAALNVRKTTDSNWEYRADDYGEALGQLAAELVIPRRIKRIHKVVLIAHSAGAQAAVYPSSTFDSLLLVEPAIWPAEMDGIDTPQYTVVQRKTALRRNVWQSREDARSFLSTRLPYKQWDPRVLDAYVDFGLTPVPGSESESVQLACAPIHEAQLFNSPLEAIRPMPILDEACLRMPVHVIYGSIIDLFPRSKQDALLNGRQFASVTRVPSVGHMIVQEVPDVLGDTILDILHHNRESKL